MSTPQTSVQKRTMYAWNSISKRGPFRSDSSSLPKNSSSSSTSNKQQVHQKSRNHHETTSTLKAGDTLPQSTMSRSQPPGSIHSHHSVHYFWLEILLVMGSSDSLNNLEFQISKFFWPIFINFTSYRVILIFFQLGKSSLLEQ